MTLKTRMNINGLVVSAIAIGLSAPAAAQTWPDKPVRIIVPFGPGGGTDIQGRLLGKKFYESLNQTFIVDNRPGAAGLIGTELAVKSPPDGYTVLFTTASLSVNVTLYKKTLTFDPLKNLAPSQLGKGLPCGFLKRHLSYHISPARILPLPPYR